MPDLIRHLRNKNPFIQILVCDTLLIKECIMKSEMKNFLLIIVVLCLGSFCSVTASATEQTLFPSGDIFSGWEIVKDSTFDGDALYGHIDGGAELFFEFGFVTVDVRIVKPKDAEDEMTLEIYKMTDPDSAAGLFLVKSANLSPSPRLPIPNIVNNFQVSYVKGDYYILISCSAGTEPLKEKMIQFGESIASKLPDKTWSGFKLLPENGKVAGSERILRGPLALQTIYPIGEKPMLWQGMEKNHRFNAYAADYKTAEGEIFSYIICEYPDAGKASIGMEGIKTGHDPYLEMTVNEEDKLILKDWNGLYSIVLKEGSRIKIYTRLKTPAIPEINK